MRCFSAAFQFTPLREGRHVPADRTRSLGSISIHAPPRGATARQNVGDCIRVFQFTPLREGRPTAFFAPVVLDAFQFTPLREGRRSSTFSTIRSPNFNSRPSARGDFCGFPTTFALQISIHAPPRGATRLAEDFGIRVEFQFTPLREGRPVGVRWLRALMGFQFTPLREGRLEREPADDGAGNYFNSRPSARGDVNAGTEIHARSISIHAPPRGATRLLVHQVQPPHFNSRPSARGDGRGVVRRRHLADFNSRPSARGDRSGKTGKPDVLLISIHAPPRGATRPRIQSVPRTDFNSRPSARGDGDLKTQKSFALFQFTPLREGRRCAEEAGGAGHSISIHAPPRGATRTTSRGTSSPSNFNSRPSARGDMVVISLCLN